MIALTSLIENIITIFMVMLEKGILVINRLYHCLDWRLFKVVIETYSDVMCLQYASPALLQAKHIVKK